jgi:hypothetical protein
MSPDDSFADVMARLRAADPDAAAHVLGRFTHRLIEMAQVNLDSRVRQKVDREDILQSVYKSFFLRHARGQLSFGGWDGLWALLALITARKCGRWARQFHSAKRDVDVEVPASEKSATSLAEPQTLAESPLLLVLTLQPSPLGVPETIESLGGRGAGEAAEAMAANIGRAPVGAAVLAAAAGGDDVVALRRPAETAIIKPAYVPAPGPEVDEALRQLERMLPGPGKADGLSWMGLPEVEAGPAPDRVAVERSSKAPAPVPEEMVVARAVSAIPDEPLRPSPGHVEEAPAKVKASPARTVDLDVSGAKRLQVWRAIVLGLFATTMGRGAWVWHGRKLSSTRGCSGSVAGAAK